MSAARFETHYVRLIEDARRSAQWARLRDEALARGDRPAAARHLTRYWRTVRSARDHLALAWPGLEVFARRELAARWPVGSDRADSALARVRRHLSTHPPAVSGLPALYGLVRRLVREQSRAPQGPLRAKHATPLRIDPRPER